MTGRVLREKWFNDFELRELQQQQQQLVGENVSISVDNFWKKVDITLRTIDSSYWNPLWWNLKNREQCDLSKIPDHELTLDNLFKNVGNTTVNALHKICEINSNYKHKLYIERFWDYIQISIWKVLLIIDKKWVVISSKNLDIDWARIIYNN
jgi:hypothetical protein